MRTRVYASVVLMLAACMEPDPSTGTLVSALRDPVVAPPIAIVPEDSCAGAIEPPDNATRGPLSVRRTTFVDNAGRRIWLTGTVAGCNCYR